MLTKILTIAAVAIAFYTITMSYSQKSALTLEAEKQQASYWPRHNTRLSGVYIGGRGWTPLPSRAEYGDFRGGGPSAGK